MYHSFKTLLLGFAGLFAFHHPALSQSNNPTVTDYLFPVVECIEPPQDLTQTPLDGFSDAILRVPRAYFSTYSSESTVNVIPYGLGFGNFFTFGPQVYFGQTQHFIPGYDKAAFGVTLYAASGADKWNNTGFPAYRWALHGNSVSIPPPTSTALASYSGSEVPFQAAYGLACIARPH